MALDLTTRSAEHEQLLALTAETMPGDTLSDFRLSDSGRWRRGRRWPASN
jgi:hypothetical protein